MFRCRIVKDHCFTIERSSASGIYTVTLRAGITILAKMRFDTGRAAWQAFRSSPETFMMTVTA